MIYVTSDIHGRFDCLKKLLDAVGFSGDDWLYIIGDVIDRHENGGVDILKWLLVQDNIELILGNHEAMMLSNRWVFDEITEESIDALDGEELHLWARWQMNGSSPTVAALAKETPQTRQDILEYLDEAPLYEAVSVDEKDYLLVHGGLKDYSPDKRMRDYDVFDLVWTRPTLNDFYSKEFVTLVGHTPTFMYGEEHRNRMLKTDNGWWCIDTGAAFEGGRPMLLCLDDLSECYIEDDGSVKKIKT